MRVSNPNKPLGRPGYGSIPHLPGSRLGPADHCCHAGQEAICWTKARDKHDRIIVTEKLDGSNVSVANIDGKIVALGRAGYLCRTSKYEQHHFFADWVDANLDRFLAFLNPGERLVGEWLAQAHGTLYALRHEPFVAFDLMVGSDRKPHDEMVFRCRNSGFVNAAVLHDGGPVDIEHIKPLLHADYHGAGENCEGAVWRVERKGAFDFIAKWVRPDKKDGALLPDISGAGIIYWNWHPSTGCATTTLFESVAP